MPMRTAMLGNALSACAISSAHCAGSSALLRKTSAIPSPVGSLTSCSLLASATCVVAKTTSVSLLSCAFCSSIKSLEYPTRSMKRTCPISSRRLLSESGVIFLLDSRPSLVRPDLFFAREELLEPRIVADRIPDGIDLQPLDATLHAGGNGEKLAEMLDGVVCMPGARFDFGAGAENKGTGH